MRFSILLCVLAAVLFGLAVVSDAWWARVALTWAAIASFLPALAYGLDRPRWLGKRSDGALSLTRVVLFLPFFLVTWGIWHVRRLSRADPFDAVADRLYVGRRPLSGELPEGTTLVVDLTSEFAEVGPIRNLAGYRCLPALDGQAPPTDDQTRRQVQAIAAHDGTLYVHCAVGHGRSAALAAAVLVIRGHAPSIAQAEQQMKRSRSRIGLNACQRRWASAMAGVDG